MLKPFEINDGSGLEKRRGGGGGGSEVYIET